MASFDVRTIDILYLRRHGHPIAFGLSEDALYKVAPSLRNDPNKQITTVAELVGVAHGEVFDWSKRRGHSRNPKLHWCCPSCGQQWWEDFVNSPDNPYLAGSGCKCVAYWLVYWEPTQVAAELTTRSTGAANDVGP